MQTLHRNNQAGRQIWTRKFPAVRRRRQSLLHRAASQTVYMPVKKNTDSEPEMCHHTLGIESQMPFSSLLKVNQMKKTS